MNCAIAAKKKTFLVTKLSKLDFSACFEAKIASLASVTAYKCLKD
jgi:hypothetical protein